jgi:hypothetical protein
MNIQLVRVRDDTARALFENRGGCNQIGRYDKPKKHTRDLSKEK